MRTIQFGRCFKEDTGQPTPIRWLVLEETAEILFVVSDQPIAYRCFDEEYRTWENSEIRKWLNAEFYDQAFSADEKRCIRPAWVSTTDVEGNILSWTEDEIFLLAMEDPNAADAAQNQRACWWLRSPGVCDSVAALVQTDGSLDPFANAESAYGIRPAMHILKNYQDLVRPETPVLEGQLGLFRNREG